MSAATDPSLLLKKILKMGRTHEYTKDDEEKDKVKVT